MPIEIKTDVNNNINIDVAATQTQATIDIQSNPVILQSIGATPLFGPTGNGIETIVKTGTSGLVDTYTIYYTNGNTTTFNVTNGSSIASIEKTGTSGLVDTYTITLTNGDTETFTVTNGKDATINGRNAISLVEGTGIDITENEGVVTISNTQTSAEWGNITGTLSDQTDLNGELTSIQGDIDDIEDLIPSQATTSNQLADKSFVNSSVATNTAYFIGTFNSVADLEAYSGTLTNNDYAFVVSTDTAGNTVYNRYKYSTATTPASWSFEYALNNSSFTSDQWAAINSGITSGDVALIETALQPNDDITNLNNNAGYITGITSSDVTTALGYTPIDSADVTEYTANEVETLWSSL